MAYFIFKTTVTALIIALASELSRRFTFLSSLLASLPLTSFLIFIWVYFEQKDIPKISVMSQEIFFLVLPSLAFFIILPLLLKKGMSFFPALGLDVLITFLIYMGYMKVLVRFKLI